MVAKMPILAKEAVKRAALKEDRQIFKTGFRTTAIGILGKSAAGPAGANTVGHTIGRKGIMIPG